MNRYGLIGLLLALLCAGLGAQQESSSPKTADSAAAAPALSGEPAKVEEAIVRALDYLEGQQHADGHWETAHRVQRRWATSWAVLAYLANGQTARAGNYQDTVKKGLAYLAKGIEKEYTLAEYGNEGAQVRALCLFTLLSAVGQGVDEVLDEDLIIVCERQVQALIQGQIRNQEIVEKGKLKNIDVAMAAGGWGVVNLSYWNTLCLAAARQCGIKVPRIVLDDLRAYWKRHYVVAFGSFYDQLAYTWRSPDVNYGSTLTVPSVIALCLLGERDCPEVQGSIQTLRQVRATLGWFWREKGENHRGYFGGLPLFYGQWHLAMKLVRSGSHELSPWRAECAKLILHDQLESGGFRFPGWDRMEQWGKGDKGFGSSTWHRHPLGYGEGWSEANLAAHGAFGLALPKGYLPAFTPWEDK